MATPPSSAGNSGVSQPLLSTLGGGYGSAGQTPTQVNPAVERAMEVLRSVAAKQNSLHAAPPIAQATAQQTLTLKEGQYVGDVKDGLPHGRGTMTYHPGAERKSYDGEWQNGKFHGRGVLKFSNGTRFEGPWENGLLHGKGLLFYADGGKYEGSFVQGKKHGKGVRTYANGVEYDGDWKNDDYDGQGKYTITDEDWYKGGWLKGKKHGQGYEMSCVGKKEGVWKNDQLWEGKWSVLAGAYYRSGTYVNGVKQTDCCSYCTIL